MRSGMKTYRGSCHCGRVEFTFESEEITGGKRCNCSICLRKGNTMSVEYYPSDRFELVQGKDALSTYMFGDMMVHHYFCKTCGVYPFHDGIDEYAGKYRVNLGCVDGIDILALTIERVDGRSF